MLENLFIIPLIFLYAVIFGSAMKITDLLGEHGLKWFKGGALLFGILFGSFGALLILSNNLLANFFIAMLIHWVLRYRIDSFEHGIAGAIMLTTFVLNLPNFIFDKLLFFVVLISYSVHGLLNDMADRKEIRGFIAKYAESNSHYFTVPIILMFFNFNYWIVLAVSALHVISYETTKYFGMKLVKKQRRK